MRLWPTKIGLDRGSGFSPAGVRSGHISGARLPFTPRNPPCMPEVLFRHNITILGMAHLVYYSIEIRLSRIGPAYFSGVTP